MLLSKKLLAINYPLPVLAAFPTEYETIDVATVSGQNYLMGTIENSGWYRITASAVTGGVNRGLNGVGGATSRTCYLYAGTRYLMWGANGGNTGYPVPTGNAGTAGKLGGGGSNGVGGGGGGGGAGGNGTGYGPGGAGVGFIAGLNLHANTKTETWVDDAFPEFSVDTVETMVLCGGGGAGFVGSDSWRSSGGGGGAWGNGGGQNGENYSAGLGGGAAGPGGNTFGAGKGSVRYGGGATGAWAIRDFTRNIHESGVGADTNKDEEGTPVAGTVTLVWLKEPPIPYVYTQPVEITYPSQFPLRVKLPVGQYLFSVKSTNGGNPAGTIHNVTTEGFYNLRLLPLGAASIAPTGAFTDPIVYSSGPGTEAVPGWVRIFKIGDNTTETQDMGSITDAVTATRDNGLITQAITEFIDNGTVPNGIIEEQA